MYEEQLIEKRPLGQTEIKITPIGLGVMQFAGGKGVFRFMFDDITQTQMNQIVQTALDGGVSWFDTAEMYGRGRSEEGLAAALQVAQYDGDIHVATKWFPLLRTAGHIGRTIGKRQRHLAPYPIDLYQIHNPYSFSSPEAEMEAMADLVEAGEISSVGVSNFDEERMRRAHAALAKRGLPLASNQMEYHLLDRSIETNGVLDAAKELGITIIAWSPLASGLLTGKFHKDPQALDNTPFGRRGRLRRQLEESQPVITTLDEMAAVHDVKPAQVALNWLIHAHGETVVAIPGASKPDHVAQNTAAMNFRLTDDEIDRLNQVSRPFR